MVLKNRETLKNQFSNGRRLSDQDFGALIESNLNRRDDQFHGLWRAGRPYCQNDVVIWKHQLWQMVYSGCICAKEEPSLGNSQWQVFPHDGDWEVCEGAMWAQVYDRVGIGVGSSSERPEARLDVRRDHPESIQNQAPEGHTPESETPESPPPTLNRQGEGRWLVFPQGAMQTQTTFLHYGSLAAAPAKKSATSYLITGLSLDEATWCSDASHGFALRRGDRQPSEAGALSLDPTTGSVMLVVQPWQSAGYPLACLGLNVETPTALLDIADPRRGHLRFLPKTAPSALYLLEPEPGPAASAETLYTALGNRDRETVMVSNAPQGFGLYQGQAYGTAFPADSDVLLQVRQGEPGRPQVGIGTAQPMARLDLYYHRDDQRQANAQVQILPEQASGEASPALSIYRHKGEETPPVELTMAVGDRTSGWLTDAAHGFVFQQRLPNPVPESPASESLNLDLPETCPPQADTPALSERVATHLAIREGGYVGIGTDAPTARLEIAGGEHTGRFWFDVDGLPRPTLSIQTLSAQTFTLSTSHTHGVLTTNTPGGFGFMAPPLAAFDGEPDGGEPDGDAVAERLLVNISPAGQGRVGIGCAPRDYSLDVQGSVQARAVYHDTNADQLCRVQPLPAMLWRLQNLAPIAFEWRDEVRAAEQAETALVALADAEPSTAPAETDPLEEDLWISEDAIADCTPAPEPSDPTSSDPTGAIAPDPAVAKALNPNERFGLLAHQVAEYFPQVVKTASDGSQSVAYTSLVPVLIQAINELNRQQRQDVLRLENQIEQLANRIALLAIVLAVGWAIVFLNWLF